ncbi:Sphingosine-1-phosphate lyase [Cyphellophora attinorum]|uniref:sphinganine-1-phosphate aldolase n=1 Tax=Cyphellophora attinorum TaxID=1664694 RepID=A0A0N1GX94_9EURO|nr:Sphingosine-1-phosphate lyase [Phialophora attinorum]KPI34850.1 Sphingosine-1-phosphate lyase [Phialophora attinorum]
MGSSPLPVSLQSKLQRPVQVSRLKSFSRTLDLIRNVVFLLFVLRFTRQSFYFLRGYGPVGSLLYFYRALRKRAYQLFLRAPGVRSQVDKQIAATKADIESKIAADIPETSRNLSLPAEPWSPEHLRSELATLAAAKRTRWEEGKVSGAVYHGGDELIKCLSCRAQDGAEVVAMVLSLFNAPPEAAGATTSGGTESILMAVLSARNKAYHERNVTEPELIIPSTAHAAFQKAAEYFKIKLHLAPCPAPAYTVSIPHVRRLINPNTILLVGSCPNYPHGIIDPIAQLSKLAISHSIPLHVDCCLGSFLVPLLSQAGFPTSLSGPLDFRSPGVTSISVDTHKYGFAPKGNSCILYRNTSLRRYQYFISPSWSGGVYGSPSIAGSRPGALIAGCWASMMSLGVSGYVSATNKIVAARQTLQNAISEHPDLKGTLKVIGDPLVSVVAFLSVDPAIDIYDIADAMSKREWHLNSLQDPPGLHVAVTLPMATSEGAVDSLIEDLVSVVREEKEKVNARVRNGEKVKKGSTAQLYGVAGSLPDKSVVERVVVAYLDTLYKA